MTVIKFPGSIASMKVDKYEPLSCASADLPLRERGDRVNWQDRADNEDAVRHFALLIAEKILRDPELNQLAPLLVDKVVVMLVNASRAENHQSGQR